jgi:hypothetical protein
MDADTASAAAMETVLHATKAAGLGNVDAGNALAQLTNASLGLGGGMSQGEQNSLLMDVLQQVSLSVSLCGMALTIVAVSGEHGEIRRS